MEERKINIWIDGYDDLFSDFDSRSYAERTLSDDFIAEVRKVCQEDHESISELKLQLPGSARLAADEDIIAKRIHMHIRKNNHHYSRQQEKIRKRAILFLLVGFFLMISASYISITRHQLLLFNILFIIIEPAGWFLVWTGFDLLFFSAKHDKTEQEFYQKLSKTKILFESS